MIERFLELLIAATAKIPPHYFYLPVAGQEDTIYRERVYCYELYHQLRKLLDVDRELARYTLSGEIDKRAHPIIERLCAPDFVFHVPGEMDNLAIIEVKAVIANQGEIGTDFEKLNYFVSAGVGYRTGIHLVYGDDDRAFERVKDLYRKANHPRLQLIWHRGPGEPAHRVA